MGKYCKQCGETKELSEFNRSRHTLDGYYGWCRECGNKKNRASYHRNRKKRLAQQAKYRKSEKGRATSLRAITKYIANNPEKQAARLYVRAAIYRGDLIRPEVCPECGKPGKVQAHHPDHSKPLDVVWVCVKCHWKIEARNRIEEPR